MLMLFKATYDVYEKTTPIVMLVIRSNPQMLYVALLLALHFHALYNW
jgi:hypothetical protein